MKRFRKKLLFVIIAITLASFAAALICNHLIQKNAAGKLYADVTAIPVNPTGLLLGTSRLLNNGRINPYYLYRIDAAETLLKSGKISYIIISGDNSNKAYNEPEDMRRDLINRGIDSTRIYLDYAGFRTFDSMIRLKEIFGQVSVTVISQPFHNERALYIASQLGINAIAYNAKDLGARAGLRTQLREKLARVKVFVDFMMGTQPKFLGPHIPIPA